MGVHYITNYLLISTLCFECIEKSSVKLEDCINETEILQRAGKYPCHLPLRYHYIWSPFDGTYVEKCFLVHTIEQGYMPVIDHQSGNINNADCPEDTFQPIPYKSNTQCGCALMKSTCNGIGQVISTNGSTDKDRTCRCDYLKGYTYVNMPADRCNCKPKGENCTCKLMECPNGSRLSPDYVCIKKVRYLKTNHSCQILVEHRMSRGNESNPTDETFPEDTNNSVIGILICILLSSLVSFSLGAVAGVNNWFSKIREVITKCYRSRCNTGSNHSQTCDEEEIHPLQDKNDPKKEENVTRTSSNFVDDMEKTTVVNTTEIKEECGEMSMAKKQLPSRRDVDVNVQYETKYQDEQSMENKQRRSSLPSSPIVDVQSKTKNLGVVRENMSVELYVAILNIDKDKDDAEQYRNHLSQSFGNENIHIRLLGKTMNSKDKLKDMLEPCRHIFIFVSDNFTINKFKEEIDFKHLQDKFLNDSFNIERVKVVYTDLRKIPKELFALNTVPYTAESINNGTYIARMKYYFSTIRTIRKDF